jgi:hypothetical protein
LIRLVGKGAVIMLASGAQHGLRMQPNLRSFSTAFAANAAPALSEATSTSAGWLSKLLGGSTRLTVPMTDPLPGVDIPTPTPPPAKAPATETTTLPNGVTIASEQTLVRTNHDSSLEFRIISFILRNAMIFSSS